MMPVQLSATLDRFEEGWAVLRLSDGQELAVLRTQLDPAVKEGTQLSIEVQTAGTADAARQTEARQLLNQLLQGK